MAYGTRGNAESRLTEDTGRAIDVSVQAVSTALTGAATEAKQDDQIALEITMDAALSNIEGSVATTAASLSAAGDAYVLLDTGGPIQSAVSGSNGILASIRDNQQAAGSQYVQLASLETLLTTAASARTWTRTSVTWTTDDGTGEIELTPATGTYQVMAVGHENAVGAGSARAS